MKSLVVFYSRTGNAKFVAETIATEMGADLEEIVDLKKRAGTLGWISAGKDASQEKETQISPTKRVSADYDLIVIGTPIWAWRPTPAIRTYVAQNNLSGKKVALFLTADGDPKQAFERTKALMPNSTFVGEIALTKPLENKEEAKKKIAEWCSTLKTA